MIISKIVCLLLMIVSIADCQCCQSFEGKKCISCPNGTHLYRGSCLNNVQFCSQYIGGFDCAKCLKGYQLDSNNQCNPISLFAAQPTVNINVESFSANPDKLDANADTQVTPNDEYFPIIKDFVKFTRPQFESQPTTALKQGRQTSSLIIYRLTYLIADGSNWQVLASINPLNFIVNIDKQTQLSKATKQIAITFVKMDRQKILVDIYFYFIQEQIGKKFSNQYTEINMKSAQKYQNQALVRYKIMYQNNGYMWEVQGQISKKDFIVTDLSQLRKEQAVSEIVTPTNTNPNITITQSVNEFLSPQFSPGQPVKTSSNPINTVPNQNSNVRVENVDSRASIPAPVVTPVKDIVRTVPTIPTTPTTPAAPIAPTISPSSMPPILPTTPTMPIPATAPTIPTTPAPPSSSGLNILPSPSPPSPPIPAGSPSPPSPERQPLPPSVLNLVSRQSQIPSSQYSSANFLRIDNLLRQSNRQLQGAKLIAAFANNISFTRNFQVYYRRGFQVYQAKVSSDNLRNRLYIISFNRIS